MKANMDIRDTCKRCHVNLWEVAEELGISETHFIRKMRRELSEEEKVNIIGIIAALAKER